MIHVSFAVLLLLCILMFKAFSQEAVITIILITAGYTYGPLLGLFAFGIFNKREVPDKIIPIICLVAPGLTYALVLLLKQVNYATGNELILMNGGITFLGLFLLSKKVKHPSFVPQ